MSIPNQKAREKILSRAVFALKSPISLFANIAVPFRSMPTFHVLLGITNRSRFVPDSAPLLPLAPLSPATGPDKHIANLAKCGSWLYISNDVHGFI